MMLKRDPQKVYISPQEPGDQRQIMRRLQRVTALTELQNAQWDPCPACKSLSLLLAKVEFKSLDEKRIDGLHTHICAECGIEITGEREWVTTAYGRMQFDNEAEIIG